MTKSVEVDKTNSVGSVCLQTSDLECSYVCAGFFLFFFLFCQLAI